MENDSCTMYPQRFLILGTISIVLYSVGIHGWDYVASGLIINTGGVRCSICNFVEGSINMLTSLNSTNSSLTNSSNVTIPNLNMTNKSTTIPNTTLPEQMPPESVNGSNVGKI
jgi:hypothetical protein